jgi:quinol monooxygenase YgiN
MKYTMARYTVRQDKLKEVRAALAEFVAAIREHEPRTLYVVFREPGQPVFVHLMAFEHEAAERRHIQSRYNDLFVKRVYPCCRDRPVFTELDLHGASRTQWLLGGGK